MNEDLGITEICQFERDIKNFKKGITEIRIQLPNTCYSFNPQLDRETELCTEIQNCILQYLQKKYKKAVYSMKATLASLREDEWLEQ